MEAPQYSIKPNVKRALFPELLKLLVLTAVFYIGILINLSLLQIPIPLFINVLVITVLLLLIVLELVLTYVKNSKTTYQFYQDRIEVTDHTQRSLNYSEANSPSIKRGFFDKIYNTGTLILQPKFKLSFVDNPDEVFSYIQNMIVYRSGQR